VADAELKPVYLITGSDGPKIETALQRLRARFSPESTEISSALDTTGDDAVALCNTGSLFGDGRLVVVEEVDGRRDGDGRPKGGWKAGDVDAVVEYLKSPAPGTVLALVATDVKKSSALGKACAMAGTILEYSVVKKEIHRWIAGRFKDRDVEVDPEGCILLVQLVGEDLHRLATEIDKLSTWAAGEPIGTREIEALTAPTAGLPTYALTDAWGGRDASRALDASETLFERESKPRRDTAARLAGTLGSHVSRLRAIKRLNEGGVGSKEAAERLRLHPFRAQKLYSEAEGFSPEELDAGVVRLAELDGALKGQSRLAPDLEVQRALVDLTSRPEAADRKASSRD
jgi:DNA polymerase III subunit delta